MISKLFDLLTPHERVQALFIFVLMLGVALFEVIGVASIMPFLAVLVDPTIVETNRVLASTYEALGFETTQSFLFFLGTVVLTLLIVSLSCRALGIFLQLRFALLREYTIGRRLIASYLSQPYVWFLDQHSGELGKTILSEINIVINQAILPALIFVAQSTAALALLGLLVFMDPSLALTVGFVLGSAYVAIYLSAKMLLSRIGLENVEANRRRFEVVNEAFGAIKELKLMGLEQVYVDRFSAPAELFARHQASAKIIAQIPRFLLEALAFGGMLVVVLYLMSDTNDLQVILPKLALYAYAGYRLIPALQQAYGSLAQIRFANAAVERLRAELKERGDATLVANTDGKMQPRQDIVLQDVHFSYPNSDRQPIKGLDLRIGVGEVCGIVGATGVGKTTAVDLLLGLLSPDKGHLLVDGRLVDQTCVRAWQACVGYVPQKIYLIDDTIAANIALGVPETELDMARVEWAANVAQIHDFVMDELGQGYQTETGEQGVRLSGGQRQRIGIARALYHRPHVLVLDEATGALDSDTEARVMRALAAVDDKLTIVVITHQKGALGFCDHVYELQDGRVSGRRSGGTGTHADT